MKLSQFKVGDLVRWKPEVLKDRFGVVVEVTALSIFVMWTNGYRAGFNHYDVHEALEIVSV